MLVLEQAGIFQKTCSLPSKILFKHISQPSLKVKLWCCSNARPFSHMNGA